MLDRLSLNSILFSFITFGNKLKLLVNIKLTITDTVCKDPCVFLVAFSSPIHFSLSVTVL